MAPRAVRPVTQGWPSVSSPKNARSWRVASGTGRNRPVEDVAVNPCAFAIAPSLDTDLEPDDAPEGAVIDHHRLRREPHGPRRARPSSRPSHAPRSRTEPISEPVCKESAPSFWKDLRPFSAPDGPRNAASLGALAAGPPRRMPRHQRRRPRPPTLSPRRSPCGTSSSRWSVATTRSASSRPQEATVPRRPRRLARP